MNLKEHLKDVMFRRAYKDKLTEDYKAAMEEFRKKHEELIHQIEKNKAILSDAEQLLRDAALKEYEETGKKRMIGGVGIREMTTLEYSKEKALDWAKEHGLALMLDKKSFEGHAKLEKNIPFVEIYTKPTATIPRNIKIPKEGD